MWIFLFLAIGLSNADWHIGETVPPYRLPDQHGRIHAFHTGTRWVVVCFEKKTGGLVNRWLADQPVQYLDFIVETSKVPERVARRMVMPRMRKFKHRILIAQDEDMRRTWPFQRGRITLIHLDAAGAVQAIYFADDVAEIRALVEREP
jgi:hypothetical protein